MDIQDYEFEMLIIKPNINQQGHTNHFDDDIYKIAGNNIGEFKELSFERASDIKMLYHNYLSNKDYICKKKFSFNTMLYEIQNFYDYNNSGNRQFDVKTCCNDGEKLVMYMYDASIKDHSQLNHMASILNSTIEPIFGPVFMTMILKKECGLKHIDYKLEDLVDLVMSLKQVTYWDFDGRTVGVWEQKISYNNNKAVKMSLGYINYSLKNHMIFIKLKDNVKKSSEEILELIKDINNIEVLKNVFTNIKIFRLRMGEYNINDTQLEQLIRDNVSRAFNEYDTYEIVMESLFDNYNGELSELN